MRQKYTFNETWSKSQKLHVNIDISSTDIYRQSCSQMFYRIVVQKNFVEFAGEYNKEVKAYTLTPL